MVFLLHLYLQLIFKVEKAMYKQATRQSFGYIQDVFRLIRPIIAMPGYKEHFDMYLCFAAGSSASSKLVYIKICGADVNNTKQMEAFFTTLKYLVTEIGDSKYDNCPLVVEPQQKLAM